MGSSTNTTALRLVGSGSSAPTVDSTGPFALTVVGIFLFFAVFVTMVRR